MSIRERYRKVRVGQYVRLRRELETNGGVMFAPGTVMLITKKYNGLWLESLGRPCPTCGIGKKERIGNVAITDVDVLAEGYDPEKGL